MQKIDFKPEHGQEISRHTAQQISHLDISRDTWAQVGSLGSAFSGVEDGDIYVCSGILPLWSGRWALWGAVSNRAGPRHMLWIHRRALEWLDGLQQSEPEVFRRIEATARADELAARKWLEMLGFWSEGCLCSYDAVGNDHIQYARISCHLNRHR